ncbi:hypothetical protein Ancab_036167 [Ancistrocladus abbreviatus]
MQQRKRMRMRRRITLGGTVQREAASRVFLMMKLLWILMRMKTKRKVKMAIKDMRNIYASGKLILVPIKEMTDVLSLASKAIDLSKDTCVRMKSGTYKGDLAKLM